MARTSRQSKILEIISRQEVETQEELVEILKKLKFDVTQATVSRDIKELGLIKTLSESGKYKYIYVDSGDLKVTNKMMNLFRESVISIENANNLIVLKTIAGSANAAAISIDKLAMSEVLGCIAGDDTVLIIVKTEDNVKKVMDRLYKIID